MAYEIDYMPVGDEDSSCTGDAIGMRFWDSATSQIVLTIDGGTRESGLTLAKHIVEFYGTDTIDLAILTHPDADHASGLRTLILTMKIRKILAITPWDHAEAVLPTVLKADPNATVASVTKLLKEKFGAFVEVLSLAKERGIPIVDPLHHLGTHDMGAGTRLHILGPSLEEYITSWLCGYECLPQVSSVSASLASIFKAAATAVKRVQELWHSELLVDPANGDVTCVNNSSVVFALEHGTRRFLFTGDAGVPAIDTAIERGTAMGLPYTSYYFFDVPHHGSRRNLGPTLLNKLFGPPRQSIDHQKEGVAYISAPPNSPKHPSRRITNALNRRGRTVVCTEGTKKYQFEGVALRPTWSYVEPIPFADEVEDVD
jgi:beta-lactamase superfamily II metal-dependent hydrolase